MAQIGLFGDRTRVFTEGDAEGCKIYLGEARRLLHQFRQNNAHLGTATWGPIKFSSGAAISFFKAAGDEKIKIFVPPEEKGKPEYERERVVVAAMGATDSTPGYVLFFDPSLSLRKQITIAPANMNGFSWGFLSNVVADRKTGKAYCADTFDYVHKLNMRSMKIENSLALPTGYSNVYLRAINNYVINDSIYVSAMDYSTLYPHRKDSLFRIDKGSLQVLSSSQMHNDEYAFPYSYWGKGAAYSVVATRDHVYAGQVAVLEKFSSGLAYENDVAISSNPADSIAANSAIYNPQNKRIYAVRSFVGTIPQWGLISFDTQTDSILATANQPAGDPPASSYGIVSADRKRGFVFVGYYEAENARGMGQPQRVIVRKYNSGLGYVSGSQEFLYNAPIAGITVSEDGRFLYFVTGGYSAPQTGCLLAKLRVSNMSVVKQVTIAGLRGNGIDCCPI
jgi:hypothetical protein